VLTEGFAGMENQCIGLAEAVGIRWAARHVRRPRKPLSYLPPGFWPHPLRRRARDGCLAPPWPDLLISSGRGSVAAALAIRDASGGKTFAVHIQTPYVNSSRFNLIVMPQHDVLRGDNVLVTLTALHRVTSRRLDEAAQSFRPLLSHLALPVIAVLVGGSRKRQECSTESMHRLVHLLAAAVRECDGSLAVTASRRTGAGNEKILRDYLQSVPSFFWDGTGENPYFGLLALADAIVVTSDSISMVSEACATGKPVYVFSIGGEDRKLLKFHKLLLDRGLTRPFVGTIERWSYERLDETGRIAAVVSERFGAHLRSYSKGPEITSRRFA
jgi:mitochondrial fission protein ELM1